MGKRREKKWLSEYFKITSPKPLKMNG